MAICLPFGIVVKKHILRASPCCRGQNHSPGSDARVLKGAMVKVTKGNSHGHMAMMKEIPRDYHTYHDVLPAEIWEWSEWKFTFAFLV